ncbi:MAG TPA: penicillin-binding protein activator [Sphingomonas sp.]|jgi:ABC-type branched-subunit amino acid transport system substrate-binding protein|uniref:penicillin-binding protein activator n=1 Tax=Sphingomonas sp. TaxID=28214 RepID=UPI002ED7A3E6
MAEAHDRPQPSRRFIGAGLLAALLLGGCQTIVPRGRDGGPPPPPVPAQPEPAPVPGGLPNDVARHRVALLVPMTGPNAAVGRSIADAATLALLDTGAGKVRITTYDTATGADAAAQKALADGNRLFLGPLLGEDVRAVSAAARAARVPVIAFSNDATVAGNGTYLLGFSPAQSIERVVGYARSKGMTRFAGLVPTGAYGRTASAVLIRAAEAAGGQVVAMQTFDRSPASLKAAIGRFGREQGYDAVLIADGGRIALQAAPMLKKTASPGAKILGTELWATDNAIRSGGVLNGAWYASVPDAMYRQLGKRYQARYGRGPYRLASLGYDAVLLTVRIAADWKVGTPFPERALLDKGGFGGVDGAFRFGRDGIAQRMLEVNQVATGTPVVVSPAGKGFE